MGCAGMSDAMKMDAESLFDLTKQILSIAKLAYPDSPGGFLVGVGTGALMRQGVDREGIVHVVDHAMAGAEHMLAVQDSSPPPS